MRNYKTSINKYVYTRLRNIFPSLNFFGAIAGNQFDWEGSQTQSAEQIKHALSRFRLVSRLLNHGNLKNNWQLKQSDNCSGVKI